MTAVVTGAAGGIGQALCRRLAEAGHAVVAVDFSPRLEDVVAGLESNGVNVQPVQADLTTAAGVEEVAKVTQAMGGLEVLVNNAGITRDSRLVNLGEDDFEAVIAVNLGAAYRLTLALIPQLPIGSIVNISSRAYLGNFGQFNYSMSKGGLVGLTRALAQTLAPSVRVNAVAPGLIGTEMAMGIPDDVRTKMIDAIPVARMGRPEEVAELVAFLASDASSYITGEVLVIGGGRSLSR
ncbi:MAG TPA: SDR family oxidoreductase [Acidimicrobiia bacterium]|nr:SDR family oxidoreductase [Acidimicrobiia bacterium]